MKGDPTTIQFGDGIVTVRRPERSRPLTANILGADLDDQGVPKAVYLDRLVHTVADSAFLDFGDSRVKWGLGGAVSTVLHRA